MDIEPLSRRDELLAWCAVLRQFDLATLATLVGSAFDPTVLDVLQDLEVVDETRALFRAHETTRRASLDRLRQQRPSEEVERHAQALHFFTRRLEANSGITPTPDEDDCLYHLGALHDLFVAQMRWDAILTYLPIVRKGADSHPRLTLWLDFYEAYTALSTGNGATGQAAMERLLARPNLEPPLRLRALHGRYVACLSAARYDEALQSLDAALPLARAVGDRMREGFCWLGIGIIHHELGDFPHAVDLGERALALFQECGAVYREAHAHYLIGNSALYLGDWARARAALDDAERLYTKLGLTHRLVMVLWGQGMVEQMLGDEARAEAAYARALAIARSPGYFYPSTEMDILVQLALLRETRGELAEAEAAFAEVIALSERHAYAQWRPVFLRLQADLLHRLGRPAAATDAYQAAIAAAEAVRQPIEVEAIKISLFGTIQYVYEAAARFWLDQGELAEAFAVMEQARARAFLDLLARQSPDLAPVAAQPTVSLAEVQAGLATGDLLLTYFATGLLPVGDHWLTRLPKENDRLRRLVVPPPEVILLAVTSERAEVHRLALDPNRLRPSAHSDDPVLDLLRLDGLTRWLYDHLVVPVEPLLATSRQVYIAPHGPLHTVPFAALRRADGRYLLDEAGPALVLVPSATVLLRRCLVRPPSRATGGLAIGYNDRAERALAHAELEAGLVARLMDGDCWIGPAAKGERLSGVGQRLRWLHIAGHATYDDAAPLHSRLHLGEADELDCAAIMRDLTLNADLVTLSSCMSGFSHVAPGDELLGLPRAFLYAGAPTVLCALARARDVVALLVMEQFYTWSRQGHRPAAALHRALLTVRAMTRQQVDAAVDRLGLAAALEPMAPAVGTRPAADDEPPFARPEFWAPFVLVGRA